MGALRKMHERLGHRGRALMIFAMIDVAQGWALIDPQLRQLAAGTQNYAQLVRWMPLGSWAVIWFGVAAVLATQAWMQDDRAAFGCAISIKLLWALGFFAAWLLNDAPRAWTLGSVWAGLALLVIDLAGWTEPVSSDRWPRIELPPDVHPPDPEQTE